MYDAMTDDKVRKRFCFLGFESHFFVYFSDANQVDAFTNTVQTATSLTLECIYRCAFHWSDFSKAPSLVHFSLGKFCIVSNGV